jgi:hypothetical protein
MSSAAAYNKAPTNGDVGPYTNTHHSGTNNTNATIAGGAPSMGANNNNKLLDNNNILQSANNGFQTHCGCLECYHPAAETLDYDYVAANQNGGSGTSKTPHPRIRERGEFYIDSFNDQPWSWSFGTNEMVCTWHSLRY